MADRTPAETASRDQVYAAMSDGLDALVHGSREALDDLSAQGAAELLAASIVRKGYASCTLASYLALAIVRLQREAVRRG